MGKSTINGHVQVRKLLNYQAGYLLWAMFVVFYDRTRLLRGHGVSAGVCQRYRALRQLPQRGGSAGDAPRRRTKGL